MQKSGSPFRGSGGKVIIIGATSGIGRELATIYAKKGYFVGITGRRNELLLSLQNKFKKNIVTTDIQPGFVDTGLAKGNGKFWIATPQKAAMQMYQAIKKKRKRAYITKRWWIIATLL